MTVVAPVGIDDRSRTVAAWMALLGGALGLHRFYLHGFKDLWGWLLWVPTAAGSYGVLRMRELGQDDQLAWVLIPWLGLVLAATLLQAVIYALTSDETWNARFNRQRTAASIAALNILAAVVAGSAGAIALISSIAFVAQRYFEYEALRAGGSAFENLENRPVLEVSARMPEADWRTLRDIRGVGPKRQQLALRDRSRTLRG